MQDARPARRRTAARGRAAESRSSPARLTMQHAAAAVTRPGCAAVPAIARNRSSALQSSRPPLTSRSQSMCMSDRLVGTIGCWRAYRRQVRKMREISTRTAFGSTKLFRTSHRNVASALQRRLVTRQHRSPNERHPTAPRDPRNPQRRSRTTLQRKHASARSRMAPRCSRRTECDTKPGSAGVVAAQRDRADVGVLGSDANDDDLSPVVRNAEIEVRDRPRNRRDRRDPRRWPDRDRAPCSGRSPAASI